MEIAEQHRFITGEEDVARVSRPAVGIDRIIDLVEEMREQAGLFTEDTGNARGKVERYINTPARREFRRKFDSERCLAGTETEFQVARSVAHLLDRQRWFVLFSQADIRIKMKVDTLDVFAS